MYDGRRRKCKSRRGCAVLLPPGCLSQRQCFSQEGVRRWVHKPFPERFPGPPGHGEHFRRALGWTPLLRTQNSGAWVFRGLCGVSSCWHALVSSGGKSALLLLICVWAGDSCWPHTGERSWGWLRDLCRAVAPLVAPWCAEEDVPTSANLNYHGSSESCVRWAPRRRGSIRSVGGIHAHRFGECWVFSAFPIETSA